MENQLTFLDLILRGIKLQAARIKSPRFFSPFVFGVLSLSLSLVGDGTI